MLSETTIDNYVSSIPPIPKIVKRCSEALEAGNLVAAADIANEDRALLHYLQNIVNKPIFGFRDEIKNIRQIFGVFGIIKAKQLLYGYYLLLIIPKNWKVFDFNIKKFQDLQARLIFHWEKIVKSLGKENSEIAAAVSIVPASLIVCEMLFTDINSTVKLLRQTKQLSYEKILFKMTNRSLFDIASMIARKWDFSDEIVDFIFKVGNNQSLDKDIEIAYLRLLLMYEMSRPMMIQSGLNDFFDFKSDFDDKIVENFYKIIEEQ